MLKALILFKKIAENTEFLRKYVKKKSIAKTFQLIVHTQCVLHTQVKSLFLLVKSLIETSCDFK